MNKRSEGRTLIVALLHWLDYKTLKIIINISPWSLRKGWVLSCILGGFVSPWKGWLNTNFSHIVTLSFETQWGYKYWTYKLWNHLNHGQVLVCFSKVIWIADHLANDLLSTVRRSNKFIIQIPPLFSIFSLSQILIIKKFFQLINNVQVLMQGVTMIRMQGVTMIRPL